MIDVMRTRVRAFDVAEIAPGVHRLGTRWVNLYLVREGDGFLLVDGGYSGYCEQVVEAMRDLGGGAEALVAVAVTHHHVDHVGTAAELQRRTGVAVHVGREDADIVAGHRRSHVPPGFYRQSWRPSMVRYLAHTVRVGGARYQPVPTVSPMPDGERLDAPGRPRVIVTSGHTRGHRSLYLDDRGVLFAGDALVNFDYATGRDGVRLHRFNEDRRAAFEALEQVERLDTGLVAFGHGVPWHSDAAAAVAIARDREGGELMRRGRA